MMNVVAMWMLLSTLGAAMVMSPEPLFVDTASDGHLQAAKKATKDTFTSASEAARYTGEGIRSAAASVAHIPVQVAEAVQQKAGVATEAVKHGSQAGLEKIGLAKPVDDPPRNNFEQWERGLQAAKERATAVKAAAGNSAQNMKTGVEDYLDNLGGEEEKAPRSSDVIKDKVVAAYDVAGETVEAAKDKAILAAETVKGSVAGTAEWLQDGAYATYKTLEDSAYGAKERVSNAAGFGQEKSLESVEYGSDWASKIAASLQENIEAAGGKTSETAGSAYEYVADGLKDVATFVGAEEKTPSYKDQIKQAADQAADILRNKGKAAISLLPNVGQGLSYGSPNTQDNHVGDSPTKAGECIGLWGNIGKSAPDTPSVRGRDWREEFLNKVGIRTEKDLSDKDVLIGNFKGYYSGGVFYKAGEILNSAATATQDAANAVGEQASETATKAGEAARHTKDSAFSRVKHAAEKVFDVVRHKNEDAKKSANNGIGETYDNLTQSGAEELDSLKNTATSQWRRARGNAAPWFLSSIKATYLLCFSSVYGSSLWVTFISGFLLSRAVPRHQFGYIQSRIIPAYLKLFAAGQGTCLVLYMTLYPWSRGGTAEKLQYLNLCVTLLTTLANVFFLEPRATKAMFEKLKVDKEEGRGQEIGRTEDHVLDDETKARIAKVSDELHMFHTFSSYLQVIGLVGMTWHLWDLSCRLLVIT